MSQKDKIREFILKNKHISIKDLDKLGIKNKRRLPQVMFELKSEIKITPKWVRRNGLNYVEYWLSEYSY